MKESFQHPSVSILWMGTDAWIFQTRVLRGMVSMTCLWSPFADFSRFTFENLWLLIPSEFFFCQIYVPKLN